MPHIGLIPARKRGPKSQEPEMKATTDKSHYYVVYDGAWKIQCDGENSEPYPRRFDALKDAVGLAHLDVRNGRDVEVIVQCEHAS